VKYLYYALGGVTLFFDITLLLIFGFICGLVNIIAAGGSMLTLPLLIFLGLPSAEANGTNRIAIMVQNVIAVSSFRKHGYFDWKIGLLLGVPALIGAIIGAVSAINVSDSLFNKLLSIIMVFVIISMMKKKKNRIETNEEENYSFIKKIVAVVTFLIIGFYGGFIQAGVGFLIISLLSAFTNLSLVRINSIKVFVIGIFVVSSLVVFIWHNQIKWFYGIPLAIGSGIGGFIGTKFAVTKGENWIKNFITVVVVIMAIRLWFWE
jgi:uncharacterized protein